MERFPEKICDLIENGKPNWKTYCDYIIRAASYLGTDAVIGNQEILDEILKAREELIERGILQVVDLPHASNSSLQQLRESYQTSVANHYAKYEIFLKQKYLANQSLLDNHRLKEAIAADFKIVMDGVESAEFKPGFIFRFITFNKLIDERARCKNVPSFG
jgi:hypothetical protein